MEERIHEEIRLMMEVISKSTPHTQKFPFHLAYAANSVISHILFKKKFDRDGTFANSLKVMNKFVETFNSNTNLLVGYPFEILMNVFPGMKKFQSSRDGLRNFTDNVVKEQFETFDPTHARGYVDAYLNYREELSRKNAESRKIFNMERLQANAMNLYFEGTESTGGTIASLFLEISKYPEIQKAVQLELDRVVGRERLPSFSDRRNLPYLDATLQELFRVGVMFAITTTRSNFAETTIEGYRIPRRSQIIGNLYSIHYDPVTFPNPEKFDPTRFLSSEGKIIKKEGPYPFGVGKRSCVGEALAQMEVFLFISCVLQNFTIPQATDAENMYQSEWFNAAVHIGTHMDAPCHGSEGGLAVNEIPPESFFAPAAVIDITNKARQNRDALVEIEDLLRWEILSRKTLNGAVVLVRSGWGSRWPDIKAYTGTSDLDTNTFHFPGVSKEAAQWLVNRRKIIGLGIDTMSLDNGVSTEFWAHRILLGSGMYGLENVANMEKLPLYGASLYVMPMKIGKASGAPVRIIATFPKYLKSKTKTTKLSVQLKIAAEILL